MDAVSATTVIRTTVPTAMVRTKPERHHHAGAESTPGAIEPQKQEMFLSPGAAALQLVRDSVEQYRQMLALTQSPSAELIPTMPDSAIGAESVSDAETGGSVDFYA